MTTGVEPAAATHQVRIDGGPTFAVGPDEDSLLRAALRAGIGFPHECNVGGCGNCRFELLDGTLATLWSGAPGLSERERRRGRHLACQSRPQSDCTLRVRCDDGQRPIVPTGRWPARLAARTPLNGDMAEFTFRTAAPARFRPGQYALLRLPGVTGVRAYSMSNGPNDAGSWQFIVRRVPGGAGSTALFDGLRVDDTVVLDGPYGHAWLRDAEPPERPRDIVCIAGGSGLAPMLSVTRAALSGPGPRRVHFFFGLRSPADLAVAQVLRDLPQDRLDTTVVVSDADGSAPWDGPTGYVHEAVERQLAPDLARFDVYFAGPPPMAQAVQQMLMLRYRVPYTQVHHDRFC